MKGGIWPQNGALSPILGGNQKVAPYAMRRHNRNPINLPAAGAKPAAIVIEAAGPEASSPTGSIAQHKLLAVELYLLVQSLVLPRTCFSLHTFYHSYIPVLDSLLVNWSRTNRTRQILPVLNLMMHIPLQPHLLMSLSPILSSDLNPTQILILILFLLVLVLVLVLILIPSLMLPLKKYLLTASAKQEIRR